MISDPKNARHILRSRSFEVKFVDKVPLTPSNVPTTFRGDNQNKFGEKCESVILDSKNGRHSPRSRPFKVKFPDKVPLTPINVPTTFGSDNQNRFGEKCKNVISDHKKWPPFPEVKVG